MLEDQVAYLLQKYLGNYVRGLNKEALKISVWQGDVELKNMQLKPEALNALNLPVKVKAGFLGSVKLKVPWSRLGQDPVLVYLDRIFLLAEPATQVEGCTEDAMQDAKKIRIQEMEMKLLEKSQQLKSEMNKSWLGSVISTVIGNLKLSISNVHIRYEDSESNPGHPFAAGVVLEKLSTFTVDDFGKETFVTGGALDRIQKSVELHGLAVYLDSDVLLWEVDKSWQDLLPSEWYQIFKFGTKDGKPADYPMQKHCYILQPVTGHANYSKLRLNEFADRDLPLKKATVYLDDVTLCLPQNGYRDILKVADNFATFNQRLNYAHFRPRVPVKTDPRLWWKYACRVVSYKMKKESGKMSWEQVLKYARLRKRYISLYASLLKADPSQAVVDDNEEIERLDRELDMELILQWRMLAHKFVERSLESDLNLRKQRTNRSWWPFGRITQSPGEENEAFHFADEDWDRLNQIIGYKEEVEEQSAISSKEDALDTLLVIHMKHNASKLLGVTQEPIAELSCKNLSCTVKLYSEAKVFNMKLGSYQLSSPNGLLAESASSCDSLVAVFSYKPFDNNLDWSMVARASPCYMTYLKDTVEQIIKFFKTNTAVSQVIAMETAAAVQTTIDEVKRTAQQQVSRALKDHARFSLDLDIAAPKITIPTDFHLDNSHTTKLLLDLGNLVIHTQDDDQSNSDDEDMYLEFDLVLSDVSAFLYDGDYCWGSSASVDSSSVNFLPIVDRCGVILKLQQIRLDNPYYPSTRLSVRLPTLGFHFSPARYHRLMEVVKIFQDKDSESSEFVRPWDHTDFEGWLSVLGWKGVGNREAVWQRRYMCLVGPFLYALESPDSKTYKQYISLRGKQVQQVPPESVSNVEHVLALYENTRSNKVVEDTSAIILRCDSDETRKTWQRRLQGAIYRASVYAPVSGFSETSSDADDSEIQYDDQGVLRFASAEQLFVTGVLDELRVCFSYSSQCGQSLMKVLLAEERSLFEFRAIGGQVELSVRENDMFIGTVLKSLEVEDLVSCSKLSRPCYLARSLIGIQDAQSLYNSRSENLVSSSDLTQSEADDKFYEAPDTLSDTVDYSAQSPESKLGQIISQNITFSSLKPPSFSRIVGLLPSDSTARSPEDIDLTGTADSFVKAQIILFDQNSTRYKDTDKEVTLTLATLSFFCRRPTIIAIMDFVNAITVADRSFESSSGSSSTAKTKDESSAGLTDSINPAVIEEPAVKGLLGKGKSRVMFSLRLKMARAQIILVNENETTLASLSQENLLTDIKVFPSSFSIKAALGNLRISDDSLPCDHMYYWVCDMRNPGGSSFVELLFTSFNADDEDYEGYDYSLLGELSEVRIVYLNRFIQEVVNYFLGLVPTNSKGVIKLRDQVSNSEKWFSASDVEGSPAMKLAISLKKPIILMPRRTDSIDFLKLDIVHITVHNSFRWMCGTKIEMNAVHLETLMVEIEDINLNVGTGTELGESIIQDVNGVSVVIHRSLRDLLHQVPSMEVIIKVDELKAALSSKEYQIITECAMSNISERANIPPPIYKDSISPSADGIESVGRKDDTSTNLVAESDEPWVVFKVSVEINLVELSLHAGMNRDASLATLQICGAWLLYKSNTLEEGLLSATLRGFSVIDNREGVEQEFRLAIGKPGNIGSSSQSTLAHHEGEDKGDERVVPGSSVELVPTMLIVDAKFNRLSTSVTLCIQRPQMLVALDFLLAVVEFFVPTVGSMLANKEDSGFSHLMNAIFLDQPIYTQSCAEVTFSPQRPLIVDDERFDHVIYDGNGGTVLLRDREGSIPLTPITEAIIYVGNGKKLQFRNVVIKNGKQMDSCVFLGANSSYSALLDDEVYLKEVDEFRSSREDLELSSENSAIGNSNQEFVIELQAIGPEFTFYHTSRDELSVLSNKLLHVQFDIFCRIDLKGDVTEICADAIGLTMESNGIRVLEPFDTSMKYSNALGKTNIHLSVSDVFMNFTFSILKLFLAVEDDILAFLRMTSKKMTIVCSHFDKVGTIKNPYTEQTYAFWRPRAPPGFAVLGDYLTPVDKPPSKGVLAVNTNSMRVKKPVNFIRIWPTSGSIEGDGKGVNCEDECSIWLPEAPKGYVALGCVVSRERSAPPLSSAFCITSSLVSPCSLRDCVTIDAKNITSSSLAFWRVDNSVGSFLPADPATFSLICNAYELRHIKYGFAKMSAGIPKILDDRVPGINETQQSNRSSDLNSARRFEAIASFQLIWWNQGSSSRKKLSIWRPVVPQGMVYFGDIAVSGYEPPNSCIALHDTHDENLFKAPHEFQLVGHIKKQWGMESISFWLPQAPPGFVSLGCVAWKGTPKQHDFSTLRCIRSDMVSRDNFLEESLWDTSHGKRTKEPFSVWAVGNELGTFIVRGGFKRPPRRFALKLADLAISSASDDTVIDAEIRTFSAALFDDYGGLMVPLFNVSLSGISFSMHGRTDHLNASVSFSLAARSHNDKYEAWEPLIEPVDGFLRRESIVSVWYLNGNVVGTFPERSTLQMTSPKYQYDLHAPGAASQLRFTSTRDLNLNISVSNVNMMIQAYASWNNLSLSHSHGLYKKVEVTSSTSTGRSVADTRHKKHFYIIPQNKLGQDIFIRATEIRGLRNIVQMPSGDMKPVKVPVSKDMLDSHENGMSSRKFRRMVTVFVAAAQFPRVEGLTSRQYTAAIQLAPDQSIRTDLSLHRQSVRTCGSSSDQLLPSDLEFVLWNEIFFFKVDVLDGYLLEVVVTDMGKGEPIGFFSTPLKLIARTIQESPYPHSFTDELKWIELSPPKPMRIQEKSSEKCSAKLHCAILVSEISEAEEIECTADTDKKTGFIQISPSKEGPWTTVRLNYAAPAACWRLGNDVVASEVKVKDGNRYVNIRSLVSVKNNTDFTLDLCLKSKIPKQSSTNLDLQIDSSGVQMDEFLETEKYYPTIGWVGCSGDSNQNISEARSLILACEQVKLPSGWEWVDDWHLDGTPTNDADGWVYAPDVESLKWPVSSDSMESVKNARQRRWIRNRKQKPSDLKQGISIGLLKPGETIPLPLSGLTQSGKYVLHLRPWSAEKPDEYSWSSVVNHATQPGDAGPEIHVSKLQEEEKLLCCHETSGTSNGARDIWFCVGIQAIEIAKDIRSDPIEDWCLVVKSPLSISNFLPLAVEFSVLEMQERGHFVTCSRGVFPPGKSVDVYSADIRNPLFLSLLPQRGWLPVNEAVLISHPHVVPSKTISMRSSISGRIVQVILEQNLDQEQSVLAKTVRAYAPYWISVTRCPPLTFRILDVGGKRHTGIFSSHFQTKRENEVIYEEITQEEMYEGHTIASALNFNNLALSVAVAQSGKENFGPVKTLSTLGDMDGSSDVYALDADGNCMRLFITTKLSPYQSVPTKVISIRPYMTFTNRLGEDIFIKLSSEDEQKILHASDARVSFVYHQGGAETLQVRLEGTNWSFPVQIVKEDTIALVLRKLDGTQMFLRTEIRGYEEGSRFIVVFRLGSIDGPIRIENRTNSKVLSIRQSGFGEDWWVQLSPLSTKNFSWINPYGQKIIETKIDADSSTTVCHFDLERTGAYFSEDGGIGLHVMEMKNIKVAKFSEAMSNLTVIGESRSKMPGGIQGAGAADVHCEVQGSATPFEISVELGVVGISVVDHRPKELSYIYLERVFLLYSTGYDGGRTNRFKLILGYLQVDNQLPLTLMPVLLAPEQISDVQHPVFKMTITTRSENKDGMQVYPYIYVRVTDKTWRLAVHEPIIWAVVDFYNKLRLDFIPQSSTLTEVDPEIRFELIDVSEVRLKLSLETSPGQRPQGVLGVWSPILSAVGNAFKIQVHLRRVMQRDRFMRKSSILPAIGHRVWRDLIHNPLHLIFSVDVLGMTSSTLASISKGFAELSTDGQFLQLRSKQVRSRRITGVGDGIMQGTEALAQGFAFGVSGVVKKPVESIRQNGLIGLAHGLGRAFLGFIVQPVSGALDFFSLTVDGIGASCSKCIEIFNSKSNFERIRNPRVIRSDGVLREYCERESIGQMVLYLAEASRHFGCTEIFKEPSKFAWSDYYEEHFIVPYQRIVLVTNKRVIMLQGLDLDKLDKKPCKVMWDVPWEDLLALELAKAGSNQPSHLILHLKQFKRSEKFVRIIKCSTREELDGIEPQAVRICSVLRRTWKRYQSDTRNIILKVPSSQRYAFFASNEGEGRELCTSTKPIVKSRELPCHGSASNGNDSRFVKHIINFSKIWSSELEARGRCTLCKKQVSEDGGACSIWRPVCPPGYVSVGDIAHVGSHPPNAAAVYRKLDGFFALPLGYDLVWRNCMDDYVYPVSIWYPRAPEGYVSLGCVTVADYMEPNLDLVYCVVESLVEETEFEETKIWSALDSYPWTCHMYQVRSDALPFVALRQTREDSDWKPMRVLDDPHRVLQSP